MPLLITSDGGRTWAAESITGFLDSVNCPHTNSCLGVFAAPRSINFKVVLTNDGGKTWSIIVSLPNEATGGLFVPDAAAVRFDERGSPFTIASTDNGGTTWQNAHVERPISAVTSNIQCLGDWCVAIVQNPRLQSLLAA